MEFHFSQNAPIAEENALAQVADLGFHGIAFDEIWTMPIDKDPADRHEHLSV